MTSMEEVKPLFSSSTTSSANFFPETPQGSNPPDESKARRRPRKKAKDIIHDERKKRRLSEEQVRFLETHFGEERKLESCRKLNLATEIGLDPKQVAVWFQNRRARWKSKQLEEEYFHLKSSHDTVLIEKCRLETEILNLKDKLVRSEDEIKRLNATSASGEAAAGGSPVSSLTMATHLGEFVMEEQDNYYNYNMMEMSNFYGIF